VPKSNLRWGYLDKVEVGQNCGASLHWTFDFAQGSANGAARGPPRSRKLKQDYFLVAAFSFFLLKPVSTEAPMLASMSLAGCA
jgi:hypothetical protein